MIGVLSYLDMRWLSALLVLWGASVNAQTITQTFGSGANTFSMDFVTIGNPGNEADTTGAPNPVGRVDYVYNLGKYEISRDQIDKANAAGGLGITMSDMTSYGGNGLNRPATGISWYKAAKFVNYLNTSQGNQAAYSFDESGNLQLWGSGQYAGANKYRHKNACYFLPSLDEWYKGAYGSPSGVWYNYPTGGDTLPNSVYGGTSASTAVFNHSLTPGPADINDAGGYSNYGTMAQGGNVWEWTESAYDGLDDSQAEDRALRGGAWSDNGISLNASYNNVYANSLAPEYDSFVLGFRVASVPEPSSLSLLLAGGLVALILRKKH